MTKFEEPILNIVKFNTPDVISTSATASSFIENNQTDKIDGDEWGTTDIDTYLVL